MLASLNAADRIAGAPIAGLSRRELLTWTVLALLANQVLHILEVGNFGSLLSSLASLNVVYWAAAGVILWRLSRSDGGVLATRRDKVLAIGTGLALCATGLISYRMGAGVVATAVALVLITCSNTDAELRAAGAVLLALAMHLAWGPIFFQMTTQELLGIDASIVMAMLRVMGSAVTLRDGTFYAPHGFTMTMIGGCSSFMNLSIALLASATITMGLRTHWFRRDLLVVLGLAAAMIALNAVRIVMFTAGPASHAYWHNGPGSAIFMLAQTAIIGILGYGGVLWAGRVERP